MTTASSAPITHSAVDENVHSYMPRTSLLVSSNLDAGGAAKVYKTRVRHDRVIRVKMHRTARFRTLFADRFRKRDDPADRSAAARKGVVNKNRRA
jgi:hypothetical protein